MAKKKVEEKETKATKKEKDEIKKEKKSNKGVIIAIVVLSIVVVIFGIIIALLLYRSSLENKTTGSEWSDIYYKFIKERSKSKDDHGYLSTKSKISFAQSKGAKYPLMIVKYDNMCGEENKCSTIDIYGIVDNKVEYFIGNSAKTAEVKLYYDIDKNEYKNYLHIADKGVERYVSLDTINYDHENYNVLKIMKEKGITDIESQEYKDLSSELYKKQAEDTNREYIEYYGSEIKVVQNKLDGSTIEYNKIDEKLVDTDVTPKTFDYDKGMNVIKIREGIVEEKKDYKDINELVNKAIEKVVKKQLEIIEKVKKDIEEAKAEIKADEEKKAKEAEEALYAKGLTVGSYNLKFGKYTTSIPNGGIDGSDLYGTITLKPNGKFHITTNFEQSSFESRNIDEDGTYTIGTAVNSFETQDAIHFKTNSGYKYTFFVCNNTYFNSQSSIYNYSGN